MGKPFHELTEDEYAKLVEARMTYEEMAKQHPKPEWCTYPFAVYGPLGCWGLMSFLVSSPENCKECSYYREAPCPSTK